jgi:hypothetical protein
MFKNPVCLKLAYNCYTPTSPRLAAFASPSCSRFPPPLGSLSGTLEINSRTTVYTLCILRQKVCFTATPGYPRHTFPTSGCHPVAAGLGVAVAS